MYQDIDSLDMRLKSSTRWGYHTVSMVIYNHAEACHRQALNLALEAGSVRRKLTRWLAWAAAP